MWSRAAADVVLVVHLAFVLFVVLGGLLALRWPRVARVHVPVALYGATIELVGFTCPLTPLEVWLRRRGGEAGYAGGFIEHYVTATLYPAGLTREIQVALGVGVLALNAIVYAVWWRRRRRRSRAAETGHIVLFEAPMSGRTTSDTPPMTIRGPRDAIERFIPLEEFGALFGGYMLWAAPPRPTAELPHEALGVWGRRTCSRFRRILRERGATIEVRREPGPEQRIKAFSQVG